MHNIVLNVGDLLIAKNGNIYFIEHITANKTGAKAISIATLNKRTLNTLPPLCIDFRLLELINKENISYYPVIKNEV